MYTPATLPLHYYNPLVFEQEQNTLFQQTWQFVGLLQELDEPNAYISKSIGNKSIVVQRFEAGLRCFLNVCSHRYSQLQKQGCGVRPLQCPYHGWRFNEAGVPVGIPFCEGFENLDKQALSLKRFPVETCGSLVFVRLSDEGVSLQSWLGDLYPLLISITNGLDCTLNRYERTVEANWKLLIENSLEGYHVPLIHPESIAKFELGKGSLNAKAAQAEQRFFFAGAHSYLVDKPTEGVLKQWQALEPAFAKRPFKTEVYHQIQVFPNLNVATFYGATVFIQLFEPLSPTQTKVTHLSCQPQLGELSKYQNTLADMVTQQNIELGHTVLEEDLAIVQQVQQGVLQNPPKGLLCKEEQRVWAYQTAYVEAMESSSSVKELEKLYS
jgi:phenylpropionate dioxygenase-like ring-hydroxylating dioxygenase large terminal subunit